MRRPAGARSGVRSARDRGGHLPNLLSTGATRAATDALRRPRCPQNGQRKGPVSAGCVLKAEPEVPRQGGTVERGRSVGESRRTAAWQSRCQPASRAAVRAPRERPPPVRSPPSTPRLDELRAYRNELAGRRRGSPTGGGPAGSAGHIRSSGGRTAAAPAEGAATQPAHGRPEAAGNALSRSCRQPACRAYETRGAVAAGHAGDDPLEESALTELLAGWRQPKSSCRLPHSLHARIDAATAELIARYASSRHSPSVPAAEPADAPAVGY